MIFSLMMATGLACADVQTGNEALDLETIDRAAVTALVEKEPDCTAALTVKGRLAMRAGEINAGVAAFENAVEQSPDDSMLRTWLGRGLLSRAGEESSLSDATSGVEQLEKAIELDPENLDARETLASFHRSAPWIAGGDMDVADEQAEYVMKRDARRGTMMMAANRMEDGDEDEAMEVLKSALEDHPDWDDVAVQLAVFYHGEGDFSNAFNLLSEYVAKAEPNPMAVYQLGRTAALSGEFLEEGRAAMQQYIAMVEKDDSLGVPESAAWWRLGMIEEYRDDIPAARAAYEKSLQLEEGYEPAREALDNLD